MSWETQDWNRREREVSSQPEHSIYFPREDPSLTRYMREYLEHRNLSYDHAYRFNWYPATYRGPRIIVPCIRTDEQNFWQGRLIDTIVEPGDAFFDLGMQRIWKRWESPFGPRGDALAYLPIPGSTLAIVEGPMDALATATAGVSAIATLGVGAPGPVLAHVATLAQRYKQILLIPDRDEMPQWIRIQRELGSMGIASEIREPRAKDLADLSQAAREELLRD